MSPLPPHTHKKYKSERVDRAGIVAIRRGGGNTFVNSRDCKNRAKNIRSSKYPNYRRKKTPEFLSKKQRVLGMIQLLLITS